MDRPATGPSLLDHFAALEDPRQQAKVLYPLPEILLLLLCATLAGADDVTEVGIWGGENLAFLRRFLPYRHGIPSHDTLGEVIAALDPSLFKALLRLPGSRACARRSPTSSRSTARPRAAPTPGARGAVPCTSSPPGPARQRLVLGQEAVTRQVERDHRHPAPAGAARARRRPGHDRRHRHAGRDRDGHPAPRRRLPPGAEGEPPGHLRGGRGVLRRPAAGRRSTPSRPSTATTAGSRSAATPSATTWPGCSPDRRYPGEVAFPGLAMIGMVESETERGGKVERERRYYLSSATLDAASFARAVRAHWGIENRLHWVWTWSSATISPGSGPATAPRTWPWSGTWR